MTSLPQDCLYKPAISDQALSPFLRSRAITCDQVFLKQKGKYSDHLIALQTSMITNAFSAFSLRACSPHGGGGAQEGELTYLSGVTRLSILSLSLIGSRLHDRWGEHMRDVIT